MRGNSILFLKTLGVTRYLLLNVVTAAGGPLTHVRGSETEWIYQGVDWVDKYAR